MADPLRSFSSGDLASPGLTVTITLPAGVQATDVVTVMFGSSRTTTINPNVVTAPAGWTEIASGPVDNNGVDELELNGFWALGNVANLTFTNSFPLLLNQGWLCAAWIGVSNTTPIDAVGTVSHNNGQGALTINAVTIATGGAWWVFGFADYFKNRFAASGFTALENGTPATNQTAAILYNPTPQPMGSTGTVSCSTIPLTGSPQILCGMPFALRPVDVSDAAVGQGVTVGQGSVTSSITVAATGQGVTAGQGAVSAGTSVTGQGVAVGQGSANAGTSVVGQGVIVGQGEATVGGDVAVTVTGQGVAAGQGSVSANQPPSGPTAGVSSITTYVATV